MPDLAVVALNQYSSIETTAKLREFGVAGASVIAGGYAEMGCDGLELQKKLRKPQETCPL